MATYYYLACDQCRKTSPLVRTSAGNAPGWMTTAPDSLPAFIGAHIDHNSALRVVSEHDDTREDYEEE